MIKTPKMLVIICGLLLVLAMASGVLMAIIKNHVSSVKNSIKNYTGDGTAEYLEAPHWLLYKFDGVRITIGGFVSNNFSHRFNLKNLPSGDYHVYLSTYEKNFEKFDGHFSLSIFRDGQLIQSLDNIKEELSCTNGEDGNNLYYFMQGKIPAKQLKTGDWEIEIKYNNAKLPFDKSRLILKYGGGT